MLCVKLGRAVWIAKPYFAKFTIVVYSVDVFAVIYNINNIKID